MPVPTRALAPPRGAAFRVRHGPFVFLRAAPDTEAAMVGVALRGEVLRMAAERDGWLRTARPLPKQGGVHGWALRDGAPLRLGLLLEPCTETNACTE